MFTRLHHSALFLLFMCFFSQFIRRAEKTLISRRMLQKAQETGYININCVDPLGRSALLMAIDNENLEMVELLINYRVDTKDALLHAISEEFVEAVEVLLDQEDCSHRDGDPHVSTETCLERCPGGQRASARPLKASVNLSASGRRWIDFTAG